MRTLLALALPPLAVLAPAAAPAPAQQTIISPLPAATVEGNTQNNFPFNSAVQRRYLQIHGDLAGMPRLYSMLSFRMNAGTSNFTGVRAIDLEMYMGTGRPVDQASFFMDANYVGPRTTTIARKVVNFGPQGQAVSPGPNPFTSNMDLVLDAPFPHAGTGSVVWEVVVHSNALVGGSGFSIVDADAATFTQGSTTVTGTGCVATGRTAAMTHAAGGGDMGGKLLINFTVANGPSSAPALLAVGATNPNLSVPGLCSNLLTDLILLLPIGTTSAGGAITTSDAGASTFVLPNTLGGGTLYTQVHALDPGRPDPIGFSNSNGLSGTVPMPNLAHVVDVARIFNNAGGVTATEGIFFSSSTVGHGLVTRFTFN